MRSFHDILAVGGHANSLGRASEVLDIVLHDSSRLEELYQCISADDAWVRMRAIDTFEKVARLHPEWLTPYVDKLLSEYGDSTQASIQWHLAELFTELPLTSAQQNSAVTWLSERLATIEVDWIVAVNCMKAIVHFYAQGKISYDKARALIEIQTWHASKSVRKKAGKLLEETAV